MIGDSLSDTLVLKLISIIPCQDNECTAGFDKLVTDVVSQVVATSNFHTYRGLQQ